MKYLLALLIAIMPVAAAGADSQQALIANCSKWILRGTCTVTKSDLKNFQLTKTGSGWSFHGYDESKKLVDCLMTTSDLPPKWIHGC